MLIDWFTVAAQALNFIILVGLLKHFLYRPILAALDAREQKIAAELADAANQESAARKECDGFRQKNELFGQQRDALYEQAVQAANAERQRLFEEARSAAESYRASQLATLHDDAQNLNQSISRQTHQEVFAIARRVLADLASVSLEEQVAIMFIGRLQTLAAPAKASLAEAIQAAAGCVVIRSAFAVPTAQCTAIQQTLQASFAGPISIRFETSPALISGIELVANGWKVSWSIADYLATLEQRVGELLNAPDKPTSATRSVLPAAAQDGSRPGQ